MVPCSIVGKTLVEAIMPIVVCRRYHKSIGSGGSEKVRVREPLSIMVPDPLTHQCVVGVTGDG